MKLTFIIPAWNAEKTLARTIDSVLRQNDDRYRIILINDGSEDRTEEICLSYLSGNESRIRYVSQRNQGLGGARNRGMELVQTEYISFLDSDDWLMPDYVHRILMQLEELSEPELPDIVLTLPEIWHEGSRAVRDWYDRPVFDRLFPEDGTVIDPSAEADVFQLEVNQCRKVLRTDFVRATGFRFQEKIKWEDLFPHFFLLAHCRRCMGIRSVGFYYRIGSRDQITALRGAERLDILEVFSRLLEWIETECPAEKRNALLFPAMRVMLRFSIWHIRMADPDTRKTLVKALHLFFRRVPGEYCRALAAESRRRYSGADAIQYRLFLFAIRSRVFCHIFCDYLYQDMGERIVKKLPGAKERVA